MSQNNLMQKQQLYIDECQYVILKIINQAVHDYLTLYNSANIVDKNYYDIACKFLFDDNYKINYGGKYKSLHDLLLLVSINIDWLRKAVIKRMQVKIEKQRSNNYKHYVIFEDE